MEVPPSNVINNSSGGWCAAYVVINGVQYSDILCEGLSVKDGCPAGYNTINGSGNAATVRRGDVVSNAELSCTKNEGDTGATPLYCNGGTYPTTFGITATSGIVYATVPTSELGSTQCITTSGSGTCNTTGGGISFGGTATASCSNTGTWSFSNYSTSNRCGGGK